MRHAELKPGLPASLFPAAPRRVSMQHRVADIRHTATLQDDEYGLDDIDDQDLVDAGEL